MEIGGVNMNRAGVCVCVTLQGFLCVLKFCCNPVPMLRVDLVVTDA